MVKKQVTNERFVKNIMTFSAYGALSQAFVIEAIRRYAEEVAASKPEQYPEHGLVHPESWIGVGREIMEKYNDNYVVERKVAHVGN